VSCEGVRSGPTYKGYKFELDKERINKITCFDGSQPEAGKSCETNSDEFIECGAGVPYIIEMLDLYE